MQGTVAIDLGSSTTVVAYQPPGGPPQLLQLDPYSLSDGFVVPSLLWLADRASPRPPRACKRCNPARDFCPAPTPRARLPPLPPPPS